MNGGGESKLVNRRVGRFGGISGIEQVSILRLKEKLVILARRNLIIAWRLRLPPELVGDIDGTRVTQLVSEFRIGIIGVPIKRPFGINQPTFGHFLGRFIIDLHAF